jgi:hypothetical protein
MMVYTTDLDTWLIDFGDDKIFRINKRKDDGTFECVSESAKIVEAIELPNKDILFGFKDLYDMDGELLESGCIEYYCLSQIELQDVTTIINDKIG